MQKRKFRKAALAFSAFLFVLWWALGTGATLAWFSDVEEVRNEFQIGLLDLDVNFKNDIVTVYTPLQGSTQVFNDHALYEPGYTQVVYFEILNRGNVDFDYKLTVKIHEEKVAVNVYGQEFHLSQYLKFGVVFGETEEEVKEKVKDRLTARDQAQMYPLETWSTKETFSLDAEGEPQYAALILYMPEDVGNVANYRGSVTPEIQLGIIVNAQQAGTMK